MKFSYSLIKKLLPQPPKASLAKGGAPAKAKLADALNSYSFETENLEGDCLDVSLPSNRYSDAASHLGIAREAGAGLGLKLKNPIRTIVNPPSDLGFLDIEVKDKNLCPRYAARYFEINPSTRSGQGKISSSPLWMQKILKTCGLKPINGVVDLMNYAMLEVGQPLHAFDFDKLSNPSRMKPNVVRIIVRRAKQGEKIETLDGQKFNLDPDMLVIAGFEKHSRKFDRNSGVPIAIAGIKGGANSGVDKNTKRIIVEAANFDPVSVFKTSRKLKLVTDASVRFDHAISPALVDWGLDRATELLVAMGAKLIDSVDAYPRPAGGEIIGFDAEKYEGFIGEPISIEQAKTHFERLGFLMESKKEKKQSGPARMLVRIPAWRTDIQNFEDLAEEIGRLSGYNRLKPRAPAVSLKSAEEENAILLKDRVRQFLVNANLNEVYSYSFAEEGGVAAVELENPLSRELKYLRQGLAPGLLKAIRDNSRFFGEVRVFEIGKVFAADNGSVRETLRLGIALGARTASSILELKGIFDGLLKGLGLAEFSIVETAQGKGLSVETGHRILGSIKLVNLEKNWIASIGEINLDALLPLLEEEHEFKPLPKYPAVVRDISVLVSLDARIGDVLRVIQEVNPAIIENADLIDEYRDEKFGGKQSITFRIVFQAGDRTLTDKEVDREMEKISAKLKKDFRAEVR